MCKENDPKEKCELIYNHQSVKREINWRENEQKHCYKGKGKKRKLEREKGCGL